MRITKTTNPEYQYAIADHQGNMRVVFSSVASVVQSVTATFETATQADEAGKFSSYPSASGINPVSTNNHTVGGSKSQYLNGGYAGMVGVTKSYAVYPGDQLKLEAFARYSASTGSNSSLTSFASALLNAFVLPAPVAGEVNTAASAINNWGAMAAGGFADGSSDNDHTKAFVNVLLFDKDYNLVDMSYAQVTSSGAPAYLSTSYTVKEAGYAYMYISNENSYQTDVYFDDVTMSYTPTNVVQYNEYYPFGLQTSNSWTRDTAKGNNYLYNDGNELNTMTGIYDTYFRGYDPSLGRFMQVDPLAIYTHSLTSYHYAGNNPVMMNDPSGALMSTGEVGRYTPGILGNYQDGWTGWSTDFGGVGGPGSSGGGGGSWLKVTKYLSTETEHGTEGSDGEFIYDYSTYEYTSETSYVYVPDDQTQDDLARLRKFVAMNFEEYNFIKNISWAVGDNRKMGKTDGITGAFLDYKPGDKINITIKQSLLTDTKKLKITIGHELQHAMYWYTLRMGKWLDKFTSDEADAISEYQAYLWEVANYPEEPDGWTMLSEYESLLPTNYAKQRIIEP